MHTTALHDWHVAHGGRMVEFAGWDMPIQYTTITDEHRAVREAVGLFDIAHMGRLRFTGSGAVDFLDHLLTNNVPAIKVGGIRYSLICNEEGGILDDVLVYRFADDDYLLVVNASNREKIVAWIDQHQEPFAVTVEDKTLDWFMLAIQGPKAIDVLPPLLDVDVRELRYYTGTRIDTTSGPIHVTRTGYTGEDGFEVMLPAVDASSFWQRLIDTGADAGIVPCGLGCRDTLRLEAAMPLYGHEMDENVDPYTAGLGFGVKLNAGDFLGKNALTAAKENPVRPVRVGLKLEGKRIAREGAKVLLDDDSIGRVTSGTFSPTLNQSIAMAMLPKEHSTVGTLLTVDIRGKHHDAEVVKLPFYKLNR